jgi:hypothetical protein
MLNISAKINKADIDNLLKNFSGALVRKAVRSALDRTGTWGKNYIANDVSSNYNLTNARVKKAIKVKRTTQTKMETSLNISGSGLSILDDFNATQDSIGIRANISKHKEFRVPHAFINKARSSGKKVIMMRVSHKRYPTTGKPGRGPSIPTLVNRLGNREKRDSDLTNHLYQELETQIAKRSMQQTSIPEAE